MGRKEDDAWRDIVDNFGDRAEIDPTDLAPGREGATPSQFTPFEQARFDGGPTSSFLDALDAMDAHDEEPGHFRPEIEEHEPLSVPRRLAWTGAIGGPLLAIVLVVLRGVLPWSVQHYGLGVCVVIFLVGIVYLFATMPKGDDDPWDDGARL